MQIRGADFDLLLKDKKFVVALASLFNKFLIYQKLRPFGTSLLDVISFRRTFPKKIRSTLKCIR